MAKKNADSYELYSNDENVQNVLRNSPEAQALVRNADKKDEKPRKYCIVCVVDKKMVTYKTDDGNGNGYVEVAPPERSDENKNSWDASGRYVPEIPKNDSLEFTVDWSEKNYSKIMILFLSLPVKMEVLKAWKNWAYDREAREIKIDFLRIGPFHHKFIAGRIARHCRDWNRPKQEKEETEWNVGDLILLDTSKGSSSNSKNKDEKNRAHGIEKDSADLLSAMFGRMGELLVRMRVLKEEYGKNVDSKTNDSDYIPQIKSALADCGSSPDDIRCPFQTQLSRIPRLLLHGESGVGKTLIARFLQQNQEMRPIRVSIPEFLHKEDDFEYLLFGYARGNHTGAKEEGHLGLLLKNIGEVVFLDEIGEANAVIQAKLLAYMDDYLVRPRGWLGTPFFCPTLIVAATNRNLEQMADAGLFRRDLLARFTHFETVPPLRERRESMPFSVDVLLQQDAINPDQGVKSIGKKAWDRLRCQEYRSGNFRELENILRIACSNAIQEGRDYLCECDIQLPRGES